jgi:hypothetical protein
VLPKPEVPWLKTKAALDAPLLFLRFCLKGQATL